MEANIAIEFVFLVFYFIFFKTGSFEVESVKIKFKKQKKIKNYFLKRKNTKGFREEF